MYVSQWFTVNEYKILLEILNKFAVELTFTLKSSESDNSIYEKKKITA